MGSEVRAYFKFLVAFDCVIKSPNTIIITTHCQAWYHGHQLLIATCMVPGRGVREES